MGLLSALALRLSARLWDWRQRRDIQLMVLAAPVTGLGLAIGAAYHFAGQLCFLGSPPWDYVLSLSAPFGMGLIAFGGLALGVVRLTLVSAVAKRRAVPADSGLQRIVDDLADRMRTRRPQVLVSAKDHPVALTFGLRRPKLIISRWLLARLDARELEAVLAHEVAHIVQHDYFVGWLATVLRDAFCYLPTSWAAHRTLRAERELACDDLAAALTGRPLALASALGAIWQHGVSLHQPAWAQAVTGSGIGVEARIARLLARSPQPQATRSHATHSLLLIPTAAGSVALAAVVAAEAMNVAAFLMPLGCTPGIALSTLL